jgi:hypothetical protein
MFDPFISACFLFNIVWNSRHFGRWFVLYLQCTVIVQAAHVEHLWHSCYLVLLQQFFCFYRNLKWEVPVIAEISLISKNLSLNCFNSRCLCLILFTCFTKKDLRDTHAADRDNDSFPSHAVIVKEENKMTVYHPGDKRRWHTDHFGGCEPLHSQNLGIYFLSHFS